MIKLSNVSKIYQSGSTEIRALDKVNLEVKKGEFAVVLGPSGSGKSTLLNLIGGMDVVTEGAIEIDGENISTKSAAEMENYRRDMIGFVFQFYNLIPSLTVRENVDIVTSLTKDHLDVDDIIDSVGLGERKSLFPFNLSGGELQRLSIARAVVKKPKILLCDEPTGALDTKTGIRILKLLKETAKDYEITLIIVTHNSKIKEIGDTVIELKDGKIESITENMNPIDIEQVEW
ncbi:MAG TPA: ABC transporter ATP-binding protein [Clostridiaceae bacterium]|nr:ABC transporter ATP-binding protein [Clostridiaceae bacterium]